MLDIKNLKVELDGEVGIVRAIDDMRLTLQRGETFALVGESGCGKSMTALALMRLLPENGRVVGGDILIDGDDVLALPESDMRSVRGGRIGMIFQEPSTSLNPVMRVGDQLVEAIETHTSLRGVAAREKAIDWLRRVGIPEPERRIDDYPFRMSGGQKQRVMIAMTLAAEPDYIVADEPTTALDVTIQAQVLDLLKDLQREHGLGLLLITHDLAVVSGMAHRVALMYAGQIIELAPADEFFRAPRHPYAQALLRALPDASRRGTQLSAIAGTVPPLTMSFSGCRFAPRCDRALPQCTSTVPALLSQGGAREVRCLLYEPGMAGQGSVAAPQPAPAPSPRSTASAQDQPLLDVQGLRVRFPIRKGLLQRTHGWFDAVDGVSYQVRAGQTLALVGESGCGKTTSGKAIVQLLRGQATIEGQALLGGKNLFALEGDALRAARRDIQIIFQDPFASLNPRMRVFDILEEGLLSLQPDLDAAARRARLEALADQVGLRREALERYPHEFSGGQRQRIAIARALAVRPKLIVCDEPTSALDVSVQAQILNLLKDLQAELGIAYLFITHNIGVVEYIADRVAVMRGGRIVEQGDCADVLERPQDAYTRRLIDAVPRLNTPA
ncbi:ABC transporter ATP-binding protein [Ideonella sp. 4Y16]|uniref:ABC transporter ATP-binding protein n=1 Tax=Ideonella alba TaxID=2824118 RepID=A0A940YD60_9BURK|nr:dipeptide ABC transporter ATP-binding protein [Ideonella alba]MBQ0930956.1 ABC transporter ATP-binding protein [Ideonella alba]MBQ0942380.1 ABC transporter ATP-binding protein [Ideonella alba]